MAKKELRAVDGNINSQKSIWKKHKQELIACLAGMIGIVLALLLMVTMFELWGVHVSGSREMWMGLIGAVLGGGFTLFGVLLTLYRQEENEAERRRQEHMPILGFEVSRDGQESDLILTVTGGELITTGFSIYEKKFVSIRIWSINGQCAFQFGVKECLMNGKQIANGETFYPTQRRLAAGESSRISFDCEDLHENIFCLLRFSYQDIFGHSYYQDLPFIYAETQSYEGDNGAVRQILEIRDIKPPVLVNETKNSLEETAREYMDYEVFCRQAGK